MSIHLSARSRLTLLYTSLFAVGGAALVADHLPPGRAQPAQHHDRQDPAGDPGALASVPRSGTRPGGATPTP